MCRAFSSCFVVINMKFVAAHTLWVVVLIMVVVVVPVARGIWLDLPSSGTKCVSEELHGNVVVLTDYYAFISEDVDMNSTVVPTISAKVTSPYGNDLHHVENVTHGQFAFTTTDGGNYVACFWVHGDYHGGKSVVVGIDWKTGIATKDWDSVAKKENLHGLDLELRKLGEVIELVHGNLIYLKNKEAALRAMNELTNSRVAWYSITSLGVCIMVSIFQILYLRRYFQKKKLI